MSVECLMRKNIRTLEPYKCARDEAGGGMRVYLDANENFAPLVDYENINRYPDSSNLDLRLAFEKAAGFPHTGIIAGNGSDELIDILFRIFCTPGEDCVLVLPPSYGEYSVLAGINDVRVETCPLNSDFSVNEAALFEKIAECRPKLLFFCSPNNPSGNLIDRDLILRTAQKNPGITVVDQAYIDFAPSGEILYDDICANERLVVLRTLSKAWALAGARIGFMAASRQILDKAYDVKYPYNISRPAADIAVRALKDREGFEKRVSQIIETRDRLMKRLASMDKVLEVIASDANFFLVRLDDPDRVYGELKKRSIVVRNRSTNLHCEGCLRITVGSEAECDELARALEEIL